MIWEKSSSSSSNIRMNLIRSFFFMLTQISEQLWAPIQLRWLMNCVRPKNRRNSQNSPPYPYLDLRSWATLKVLRFHHREHPTTKIDLAVVRSSFQPFHHQDWSLTQFDSDGFSQSRVRVEKGVFHTIKVWINCSQNCSRTWALSAFTKNKTRETKELVSLLPAIPSHGGAEGGRAVPHETSSTPAPVTQTHSSVTAVAVTSQPETTVSTLQARWDVQYM